MKLIHIAKGTLVALALLAVSSTANAANLILNGGFETGDFTSWTTSVPAVAPDALVANEGATIGSWHAAFGPDSAVILEQTIPTAVGGTYDLTYWLANAIVSGPGTGPDFSHFSVSIDSDPSLFSIDNVTAGTVLPYTQYTHQFTATGTSTTVKFSFTHPLDYWYLDGVSVDAVPEPSSIALFGSLLLFGTLRRKRS